MSTAQRFIRRSMAKGVIVATLLLPLPSFSRPSSPQLVVISRMGPNSVHVERTQGEFRDTINLMFDRVPEGVHIEGTYRSSNGSELHYRAQVAPKGGYVSIHEVSAQEVFTVRFARRDLEGCAYGQLVSVRFGDREVAVDEGALERNLPQLVEIAEALRQSRMLPLILDSQSLIQAAREKIAQRSAKNTSLSFVQEVLAASCFWEFLECAAAAIGYAANIAGMLSCAVPTPACVLNILAHPGTALALAVECSEWVAECVQ